MATYVPTDWETDDVITATKLNNMETGIAGALQTSGGTMTGSSICIRNYNSGSQTWEEWTTLGQN